MRFRLLHRVETAKPLTQGVVMGQNNISGCNGHWKPIGGVGEAETHEEALRRCKPVAGRWLVLCETDKTWRMFVVSKRTETDLEPIDDSPELATALLATR